MLLDQHLILHDISASSYHKFTPQLKVTVKSRQFVLAFPILFYGDTKLNNKARLSYPP